MIGLALMAWELAKHRQCGAHGWGLRLPASREIAGANPFYWHLSAEYYRILDSIAAVNESPPGFASRIVHHAHFEYVWERDTRTLVTRLVA